MSYSTEKIVGGMLLIAGSCIGAGMLAMPIITGLGGFLPSCITLLIAWSFVTFTSLLLVEIYGSFGKNVHLLSMVERVFGTTGRSICWLFYLALFYPLLVAYIAASGQIFTQFLRYSFQLNFPVWAVSSAFVLFFGVFLYLGTRFSDLCNRVLMAGLIVTYLAILYLAMARIQWEHLLQIRWDYVPLSLPVLVISFGFQNMIPSITDYLDGDIYSMRKAVFGGSLLVLIIYFLWELSFIGVVPFAGARGLLSTYQQGKEASFALQIPNIAIWAKGFSFFAIVTSFVAQALTLMDFIKDGLNIPTTRKNRAFLTIITVVPPLIFSISYPKIFYQALNFSGGISAIILFGILPVAMVWAGRYYRKFSRPYQVTGGKWTLSLAMLFALLVFFRELTKLLLRVVV